MLKAFALPVLICGGGQIWTIASSLYGIPLSLPRLTLELFSVFYVCVCVSHFKACQTRQCLPSAGLHKVFSCMCVLAPMLLSKSGLAVIRTSCHVLGSHPSLPLLFSVHLLSFCRPVWFPNLHYLWRLFRVFVGVYLCMSVCVYSCTSLLNPYD